MSTTVSHKGAAAPPAVTPERIFQFAWGYALPLVIEAAIRHRVFDVLDQTPMTLPELQQATGASLRGLAAIANVLVGINFLAKDESGIFSLTAESSAFLVSTKPSYQGGLIRHTSEHLLPKWLQLNEIVATGKPARSVNDESIGAEFFQGFVSDLFPMNYPAARNLAEHLNLAAHSEPVRALDLAAGSGVWGICLAQSAPHVHVTAVDWPGVIDITRKTTAKFGLAERYTFVQGDLHSADFGTGHHIATLGHILHSEGVARSQELLKKTFDAMASGGTIAIAEFLVDDDRTGPVSGLIFAVNMLVNTDHGDTFSFEEISEWLLEAGFKHPRRLHGPGASPLILATRP